MIEWIIDNQVVIIAVLGAVITIAKFITNLTPSDKDDKALAKIVGVIDKLIDLLVPNVKKGGGLHNPNIFKGFKK